MAAIFQTEFFKEIFLNDFFCSWGPINPYRAGTELTRFN